METEKLIKLVEERRLLYDANHEMNKDRYKKSQAWREVADAMGAHNSSFWCSKWKSLRDNYTKHRRSQAQNDPMYHKYRNWPWARYMTFMDGHTTLKTHSKVRNEDPLLPNTQDSNFEDNTNYHESEPENNANEAEEPKIVSKKQIRKFKSRRGQRIPNSKPTRLVKKTFDEIDLFFLSYAKNLKRLSKKSQALMKLEIASLFTRFELNEATEGRSRNFEFVVSEESLTSFEDEEVNFKMES